MRAVGRASDGRPAWARSPSSTAPATGPDVVLMDLMMPSKDGIATTTEVKGQWPEMEVVVGDRVGIGRPRTGRLDRISRPAEGPSPTRLWTTPVRSRHFVHPCCS